MKNTSNIFSNINSPIHLSLESKIRKLHEIFRLNWWKYLLIFFGSIGIGFAVIVSTHFAQNVKLLIGLVGGIIFVLVTMKWPELSILFLVALLSGLISTSWLPILHLGPISLNISDIILIIFLGLVFLRVTTQRGYKFITSPLLLPLILFLFSFMLSAANAILIYGVGFNAVLRTVRTLSLWIIFIPTLQLIRDEKALRRVLIGLIIFTVILLIGVVFPNKFEPFLPIEERGAGTGSEVYSDFTRFYYAGDMVLYTMIPITVASLAITKKGNQLWRTLLLGVLLYWAFKTFFRQYWLTLFVACFLLIVFLTRTERWRFIKRIMPAVILGILIVIILAAALPGQVDRVVYVLSDRLGSLLDNPFRREGSLQWRVIETRYALRQIGRHPVFGLGLANSYRPPMESEADTMYSGWASRYIENGYLYIAVFMGLVGLIPFIWLCVSYLLRVLKNHQIVQDPFLRPVFLGLGFAFLGMAACNIASPTFVFGTRLVFFPFAMAISEIILKLEREKVTLTQGS